MSYDTDFQRDKLEFIKKYSVCPESGTPEVKGTQATIGKAMSLVLITNATKMRARAHLDLHRGGERGALFLNARATNVGFQIYFLPWLTHNIVGMTIPAGGPDIFFTAAINGCSVFVKGPANRPSVYHAGIGTNLTQGAYKGKVSSLQKAAKKGDAPLFWRLLLDNKVPGASRDPRFGEVNKTHYVRDGTKSRFDKGNTTKRADAFDAFLRKKGMNISLANPWGCVFGFREGGNWSFYLQENLTLLYNSGAKKGTSIPIAISRFYPPQNKGHELLYQRSDTIPNPETLSDTVVSGWTAG
jgi:hypothetical protein